ncbi:MAG: two-component system, NarL family, sensor histidine kinase DesK [Solirubrobacteraceae bacterium]
MHPRRTVRPARYAGIFSLLITTPAIIGLIGDEPTAGRLVAVIAAMVVFIVVFMHAIRGRAYPQPPAVVLRAYVLMLAIAATLTVADRKDWGLLFYYAIALGAVRLPSPWNIVAVPVSAAVAGATTALGGANASNTGALVLSLLGIGAAMVAMGEIMRANRELHDARADLARLAVADERERFARDLHDLLGHSLSVIALKAQLARRRLPGDPEAALDEVGDIETVSRDALREVREAVSGYRKPALDAELQGARTALDAAGIETTIDRPAVELPADVEAVLAWTVREAATNVIRHSGASHSTIRVVPALDQASVEIVDDGPGINGSDGGGTGLTGLRERLRQAGGRLEAGPRDDGPGFRVRAIVPVASAR